MPSIWKHKTAEKTYRQSEVLSDIEDMTVILRNYLSNEFDENTQSRGSEWPMMQSVTRSQEIP